jgi:hypothetical protein
MGDQDNVCLDASIRTSRRCEHEEVSLSNSKTSIVVAYNRLPYTINNVGRGKRLGIPDMQLRRLAGSEMSARSSVERNA